MSNKTYIDGADTGATPATADTLQCDTAATADVLRTKLSLLQAQLHKEFRWYCDTILQGGSLAVRIAYRVHCAVETIEMVDAGEVRDDPALGEPTCYIGTSLYSEEELDKLLDTEYLLDDLYDAWCGIKHTDEEWSDTLDRYLDTVAHT